MWWEVVFPSLLPFFILSELLIGFGVVKFVGLLLELGQKAEHTKLKKALLLKSDH